MAENKKIKSPNTLEDIQRGMWITQLASLGVPQAKIREIVGVDIHRVSNIVKNIPKNKYGNTTE